MKHRSTFGIVACIAIALTSCAAEERATTGSPSTSQQQELPTELLLSDGGSKAIVHSGPSSAPRVADQVAGTLTKDGAGCITVEANDGDDWTLIFPEGTNFDGESIVLPDKASISEGKRIVLDGARVPANESLSMCLNYARLLSVEKVTVVQS